MYNKCCVVSCASRRKDVNFHMFPKSEIGLRKWLECINCERLRSLSFRDIRKQFLCRKHFEKRFLASPRVRARLRPNAYPTLFTVAEISSGIPETSVIHPNYVSHEHDYTIKRQHEDHTYCKAEAIEKRSETESEIIVQLPAPHYIPVVSGPSHSEPTEISKTNRNADISTRTKSNRRVICKKNKLTPHCARLRKIYRKSQRQSNYFRRARKALIFSKTKSFEKLTDNMNPLAKKFIWMQIKQCTKKSRGRRFSDEEKLIAMSIMKQSPKCYRFLHKIFILPSKYTLNKMIANLNVEAGLNPQIFDAIKEEVNTWDEKKKFCSILFDEVALEAALTYDKHNDIINGFVELNKKTNDFADHALVFMLRGAVQKWQQPLAFYFCKGATSGVELKKIIRDIVVAVSNTGLLPIALVSDQGTAFQSALKSLQEDTRREQIIAGERIDDVITINGHSLSVIHDPPHLIKGLRNNFLTKKIKFEGKISKWSDIVDVYKTDCNHAHMRLLHKLTDEHVIPEKIKKMKVKNCTAVFSKTMAATLSYSAQFSHYADGREVSSTLKNTAEIVSFFDDLFDSVNGTSMFSKSSKGKPLRHAVTDKSPHHEFWKEAINKLEKIKFVDDRDRETSVPSLKNWVTTLKSYQRVWHYLKDKNVKIMRPRYLNSDPIENFFGQVRAYNFRNNNPDCQTFKSTFRSLLITRFIKFHSESYNCEEDSGEQLLKLKALFDSKNRYVQISSEHSIDSPDSSELPNGLERDNILLSRQERLNVHSRAYTAGWVIRKILKKGKCTECEESLSTKVSNYEKDSIHNWISYKEFKSIKLNKLTYPSEYAVRFFGNIILEANKYLEKQPQQNGLIKALVNIIKTKYRFEFLKCELHKDEVADLFLALTLRLAVFNWCNIINRILKGTDVCRLQNKILPSMQLKAYNKYKTKLRNKKINK